MQIPPTKKLYFPALAIVAAVLLLLVLISISTFRNLDRDRTKALNFVHSKGLALIHALEAGARAGMMRSLPNREPVENLLTETSKIKGIAYIFLINAKGDLIYNTQPPSFDLSEFKKFTRLNEMGNGQIIRNIRKLHNKQQIYELGKRFSTFPSTPSGKRRHTPIHSDSMIPPGLDPSAIIVLGLSMEDFEDARQMDIHHAAFMVAIVVALGAGAIFFMFVIRKYHLMNRRLQEIQDYSRLVVDNMANGLLSIDTGGRVVSYNRLTLDLLGLDESEISGMALSTVIDFQSSGISDTLLKNKTILEKEINFQKAGGIIIPLSLSVTPILNDAGNCSSAVILLRDLREIKQLEQEVRRSEKLAAIGELAASVAHEIRNPLSSIRGFTQFLRRALAGKPKEQEYADIMVREIDRINNVVSDLLTFAMPMKAEIKSTNIAELVDRIIFLIQADAEKYGIDVSNNVSPDLPEMGIDPNLMTQALLNLTLNAVQMMKGGGSLEIGSDFSGNGNDLLLWAEDDGPGVLPENMEKIFDPFVTTRDKGTGLGLSIVRKIIENHNGNITVESPPDQKSRGCRFTITVPINKEN